MTAAENRMRVQEIATRHAKASTDWAAMVDGDPLLVATDAGARGTVATMHRNHNPADFHFLARAHSDIAFLLARLDEARDIVQRAQNILRQAKADKPERKNVHGTSAALVCREPEFLDYLRAIDPEGVAALHGSASFDQETVCAAWLRNRLGIASRAQLNDPNCSAIPAWKNLRKDFEQWKRTGQTSGEAA